MALEIVIPRLGWSMEQGTFLAWLRHQGDRIRPGDLLFELEGEKAVQEIEAVDAGILHIPENGPAEGTVVKVGSVVGYLLAEGEAPPVITLSPTPTGSQQTSNPPALLETPSNVTVPNVTVPNSTSLPQFPTAASPALRRMARQLGVSIDQITGSGPGGRILPPDLQRTTPTSVLESTTKSRPVSSPRARRIARELGVDWTRLTGTGTRGRIRERDVRAAATGEKTTRRNIPSDPSSKRVPITSRRRVIAERMLSSAQQTAPVTLHSRVDATRLVKLRADLKASAIEPVPTYQDVILQLVARALVEHPLLGAIWDETTLILPTEEGIHLGIAVDTPEGLLVPVLKNVSPKSLPEIAAESRRLIERARSGKLAVGEMQGAVFTVTNLGAFGVEYFSPIINLPQSAILGLGTIRSVGVFLDDGTMIPQPQLSLSLTFDHRVIDGGPAAAFLHHLAALIANL